MRAGRALVLQAFMMLLQGLLPIVSVQLLGAVELVRHLQLPFPQQITNSTGQGQSQGQRADSHTAVSQQGNTHRAQHGHASGYQP